MARAVIRDTAPANGIGLPQPFQPTLPQVNTSAGVIKSYILPDKRTGVVRDPTIDNLSLYLTVLNVY